tara:strand:- start:417 stop:860 length:444 start_codon:yes stop_codon:yes gene_type:complete
MDNLNIKGVALTPLQHIETSGGSVLHSLKASDKEFKGFGEAYFSIVNFGKVRGWKKHNQMTSNLIVPMGEVKFVLVEDKPDQSQEAFNEIILSRKNFCRLTIPPGIWLGFQGLSQEDNLILNLANIEHDPAETDTKNLDRFDYDWTI